MKTQVVYTCSTYVPIPVCNKYTKFHKEFLTTVLSVPHNVSMSTSAKISILVYIFPKPVTLISKYQPPNILAIHPSNIVKIHN